MTTPAPAQVVDSGLPAGGLVTTPAPVQVVDSGLPAGGPPTTPWGWDNSWTRWPPPSCRPSTLPSPRIPGFSPKHSWRQTPTFPRDGWIRGTCVKYVEKENTL